MLHGLQAEGYIIAADLAKQAAEAANIADAAQDQALRHLMVARRLSHETDLHTQREAELRSAAQFIDQLVGSVCRLQLCLQAPIAGSNMLLLTI